MLTIEIPITLIWNYFFLLCNPSSGDNVLRRFSSFFYPHKRLKKKKGKELDHHYNTLLYILWCLMPLSTIFQLYRGGQFHWSFWSLLYVRLELKEVSGGWGCWTQVWKGTTQSQSQPSDDNSSCGVWLWAKTSLSGYIFVSVLSIVIVCHFVVISTITYLQLT